MSIDTRAKYRLVRFRSSQIKFKIQPGCISFFTTDRMEVILTLAFLQSCLRAGPSAIKSRIFHEAALRAVLDY
jgi:hypothetical protein